jgi:hypothetical protein
MREFTILLLMCCAVTGCEKTHSAEYYKAHSAERTKVLNECLFNGKAGADCKTVADVNTDQTAAHRAKQDQESTADVNMILGGGASPKKH